MNDGILDDQIKRVFREHGTIAEIVHKGTYCFV